MRLETIIITPEQAEEMLAHNIINRTLNAKRVNAYVWDIKNGKWQTNGEAIKFNKKGELIDGQHRLAAISKAGTPIEMCILYDIDDDVSIFDRGRNRTVTDSLVMGGMDKSIANNNNVAIAKHYFYMTESLINVSDSQVREFLIDNQDYLLILSSIISKNSAKSARVSIQNASIGLSLLTAIKQNYPVDKLERWGEVVKTGFVNSVNEQAAIVFRNDLISGTIDLRTKPKRRIASFQAEKSIMDFIDGKVRKQSYANWKEPVYSNY